MIRLVKTDSKNKDFIQLVHQLDADLAQRDVEDHAFYDQFNSITGIKYAVVAYERDKPLGCGAMKGVSPSTMEIKRMYVSPQGRGRGIATRILAELENWAATLSMEKCVLETGKRQPEAVALYRKNGYRKIPNYGQYKGVENSLCFEKMLA